MPFAYVDLEAGRHWMTEGNVRSWQDLQEQKARGDVKVTDAVLEAFLVRNTLSVTKLEEVQFEHPFVTKAVAEQSGMGFHQGVPVGDKPIEEAAIESVKGKRG